MVIKTRTAIIIIVAAFFLFSLMAVYLINRMLVEFKQQDPVNSTYVAARWNPQR